jgi:hypothetical protein
VVEVVLTVIGEESGTSAPQGIDRTGALRARGAELAREVAPNDEPMAEQPGQAMLHRAQRPIRKVEESKMFARQKAEAGQAGEDGAIAGLDAKSVGRVSLGSH